MLEGAAGLDTDDGTDVYLKGGQPQGVGAQGRVIINDQTFPNAQGSDGQFLRTDAAGVMSWVTIQSADEVINLGDLGDVSFLGTLVGGTVAQVHRY